MSKSKRSGLGTRDTRLVKKEFRDAFRTSLESRVSSLEPHALRIASCVTLLVLSTISFAHADTLTDPMRPANLPRAAVARGAEPAARVTAVFLANGRRVAVLDGRVVKQGDRIGDLVIQEVLADGVRYTRGGRSEIVRLPRQDARVRRSAVMDGE